MRRLLVILVLATACRSAPAGNSLTGADAPRTAVERFLLSAQSQDLQAMSAVWGDERGPVRNHIPRDELEKRELIMMCLLKHDQSRIADPTKAEGGRLLLEVNLTQGRRTAQTSITVTKGPSDRWYVEDVDLTKLQNAGFCSKT